MTGTGTHSLLLIEDSSDDALLFQTAFARATIPTRVEIVPSGQAALDYLKGEGPFARRERFPMPRLVFLDLHLPGMGGLEILKSLRRIPALKSLPVIVFTGSPYSQEIVEAYGLGANSFLVKPNGLKELTECLSRTLNYWLGTSLLPEVT